MIVSDDSIRTSYIGSFQMISAALSAVVNIGDAAEVNARSIGLAVQRQLDNRAGGEVDFAGYTLFTKSFHTVEEESPDAADIRTRTVNPNPCIAVGTVNIIAGSSASVLVAGNVMNAHMESRLKHFRQFAYSVSSSSGSNPALKETIQSAVSENSEAAGGGTAPSTSTEPVSTTRDK
jgi:hypothetical protein